jgi:hypothetical protein
VSGSDARGRRRSPLYGEAGYARVEREFYPTEPWCVYQLLDALPLPHRLWEPACGDGRIVEILRCHNHDIVGTDIADHSWGARGFDFLADPGPDRAMFVERRSIITNPPNNLSEAFVRRAIDLTRSHDGMAVFLLPVMWDCAGGRRDLFEQRPYAGRWLLTQRPYWAEQRTSSPRMPYAWHVWDWRHAGPPVPRYLPANPERAW